jgi:hypothetical protein
VLVIGWLYVHAEAAPQRSAAMRNWQKGSRGTHCLQMKHCSCINFWTQSSGVLALHLVQFSLD